MANRRIVFSLDQLDECSKDPAFFMHIVRVLREEPDMTTIEAMRFARAAKRQLQLEMPVNGSSVPQSALPPAVVDASNARPELDKADREFLINSMTMGLSAEFVDGVIARAPVSKKREFYRDELSRLEVVH